MLYAKIQELEGQVAENESVVGSMRMQLNNANSEAQRYKDDVDNAQKAN